MRFVAEYRKADTAPYFRTVDADSLNEASRTARRYVRKGYIMATLKTA